MPLTPNHDVGLSPQKDGEMYEITVPTRAPKELSAEWRLGEAIGRLEEIDTQVSELREERVHVVSMAADAVDALLAQIDRAKRAINEDSNA